MTADELREYEAKLKKMKDMEASARGDRLPSVAKDTVAPSTVAMDPQSIELAKNGIDLMEQKLSNVTAQIERQREVMAQLLTEAKSGSGAELDAKIASAQGRLISLQQTAFSTQAALDKAISAPAVAAEKAAQAAQAAQEKAAQAAARAQERAAEQAQRAWERQSAAQERAAQAAAKATAQASDRAAREAARAAEQSSENVKRSVSRMGEPMRKFGLSIKRALKSVFLMAGVYALFRSIKQSIIDATKQSESFQKSVNKIKANLQVAFTPLKQAAMPYLEAIAAKLAEITQQIAIFSANLFGMTYKQAVAATKQAQTVEKAAKKAKGALAGFDQINVLDRGSDDESGGADLDALDATAQMSPAMEKMLETLDKIKAKVKELAGYFAEGFKIGFGDTNFDAIKEHIAGIGKSLRDIFTDPLVVDAGARFVKDFMTNLGRITGSVASIGITIAENLLGGLDMYLAQNKDRIKQHIIDIFDLSGALTTKIADLFDVAADIFTVFRSDGAKQITADLIGIFVEARAGATKVALTIGNDVLAFILKPLQENKDKIKDAIKSLFEPLHIVLDTVKRAIQDTFDTFLRVWNERVSPALDKISSGISELLGNALDLYQKYVAPMVERIANGIKKLYDEHIKPFITTVMELVGTIAEYVAMAFDRWIKPAFKWIQDTIVPIIVPIFEFLWNTVKNVFGFIIDIVKGTIDGLRGFIDFITGIFTGDFDKAMGGIKTMIQVPFDAIEAFVKLMKDQFDAFLLYFENLWQGIVDAVEATVMMIIEKFTKAWDTIKFIFSHAGEFFSGIWDTIKQKFTEIGAKIGDAMGGAFKTAVNAVLQTVENVVNAPINAINRLVDVINAVPGINLGYLNNISLPRLAQGGVFAPNQPTLAIIGDNKKEKEIAAPESLLINTFKQVLAEMGGAGGGDVYLKENIYLDDGTLIDTVERRRNRRQLAGGYAF